MSAQPLLDRLERVRRTAPNKWIARCPAHDDKHPSLAIKETDDGWVLLHCFAQQCSFHDIISAVGVEVDELFPPKPPPVEGYKPERRPFIGSDLFDVVRHEAAIAWLIAADLKQSRTVSEEDYSRLSLACQRLEHIAEAAYAI